MTELEPLGDGTDNGLGKKNLPAIVGEMLVVTDGATFEELQENIRDAVALYFEGSDPSSLGFAAMAS